MEQNQDQIKLTKCPLCESNEIDGFLHTKDYFFTLEKFTIERCNNCSLVFTNPLPPYDQLPKYYDTENYLSHNSSKSTFIDIIYRTARFLNIRSKYKLVNKFIDTSTVLDIGSGTGELLSYFKKKGWKTTGIEPNKAARNLSIKKYGLSVFGEEKIDQLEKHSFDLVMMWHVLEHVADLSNLIKQVKKVLKKEGVIVIAVPNINSPDFKYYKQHWAGLDVPRHLYHFSKDSINYLFKIHDIQLDQVLPMKMDAYYISLLSEKYKGGRLKYLKSFSKGFKSNFLAKRQDNNYSSMIFVARKN